MPENRGSVEVQVQGTLLPFIISTSSFPTEYISYVKTESFNLMY